jgi:hypothetical protein
MGILEWIILAIVIAGIVIAFFGWDRYRSHRPAEGDGDLLPTNEVFVDPASGQQMRVWYNQSTGAREYRAEGSGG